MRGEVFPFNLNPTGIGRFSRGVLANTGQPNGPQVVLLFFR
jgi:hypothetical protein